MTSPRRGAAYTITIESQVLGCTKHVQVWLPPGYAESDARYPAVYLFRSHQREWLNPTEDSSRGERTAGVIADELLAAGTIPPLLLVMPGLASEDNAIASLGVNMRAPERAADNAGVGTGQFADYLTREVLPTVDRELRTRAERGQRATDGFSLGGFTAVSLALCYPDLFASTGAFDGTFLWPRNTGPDGTPDPLPAHAVLAPALGSPPDLEFLRSVNPTDLALDLPAETLQSITFHIESAPEEIEPGSNYHRTQRLLAALAAQGADNSFTPAVLPGSEHRWWSADEHLKRTLPLHAAVFSQPKARFR